MSSRILIASLALVIGLLLSWLLSSTPNEAKAAKPNSPITKNIIDPVGSNPKSDRKLTQSSDRDRAFDPNAVPYERIIAFSDEDDYRKFLKKLANSKLRHLGQIDALRAIRLGFDNLTDFDGLDLDPDQLDFNYSVTVPELREVAPQDGLVGFGTSALEFLGITVDNSEWGRGVKIAIIDTGIEPHLALSDRIQHINLVELAEGVEPNSHGTSVASLIAGTHPNMKGVAPAADLISVRVADETGYSTSFLLAQGIIAATDAGAQLINISLGSQGDSTLVRQAVEYATSRGAVIFASSGNEGSENASFPAGNADVYSVGAVDALGQHLNFSNTDDDLSFTAPGLEVRAAVPGDNITSFTGTSGSVAFPVGAVAAIMSESPTRITAQAAVEILQNYTNEAGSPGNDPQYGNGIINVGRVLQRDTPGIEDIAVASQTFLFPTENNPSGGLQVSVENRGTEPLYQSTVEIDIAGDRYPVSIQVLQPNERRVITIPTGLNTLQNQGQLNVKSDVNLNDGSRDAQPANDQRDEVITLPDSGT
ncbi:MAG: hypothetical protein ACJAQT_002225 [Akkermansiaceae bacterium]|jgi:hypothetical protein